MEARVQRAHVDLVNAEKVPSVEQQEHSIEHVVLYHIAYHGHPLIAFGEAPRTAKIEHYYKGDLNYDNEENCDLCQSEGPHSGLIIESHPANVPGILYLCLGLPTSALVFGILQALRNKILLGLK